MGDVVNSKKGDSYSWGKCMTSPCENTQPFISLVRLFSPTCFESHGSGPFPFHTESAHLIADIKGFSRQDTCNESSSCAERCLVETFEALRVIHCP